MSEKNSLKMRSHHNLLFFRQFAESRKTFSYLTPSKCCTVFSKAFQMIWKIPIFFRNHFVYLNLSPTDFLEAANTSFIGWCCQLHKKIVDHCWQSVRQIINRMWSLCCSFFYNCQNFETIQIRWKTWSIKRTKQIYSVLCWLLLFLCSRDLRNWRSDSLTPLLRQWKSISCHTILGPCHLSLWTLHRKWNKQNLRKDSNCFAARIKCYHLNHFSHLDCMLFDQIFASCAFVLSLRRLGSELKWLTHGDLIPIRNELRNIKYNL